MSIGSGDEQNRKIGNQQDCSNLQIIGHVNIAPLFKQLVQSRHGLNMALLSRQTTNGPHLVAADTKIVHEGCPIHTLTCSVTYGFRLWIRATVPN